MSDDLPGRARLLDEELCAEVAVASPERRRRIAINAARAALTGQPHAPRELVDALSALAAGRATAATVAQVRSIADRLDDDYLTPHDDEKPGGQSGGWEPAFRLARTAAAVVAAFDDDPTAAAVDAAYEAWHALDGDPSLRAAFRETP